MTAPTRPLFLATGPAAGTSSRPTVGAYPRPSVVVSDPISIDLEQGQEGIGGTHPLRPKQRCGGFSALDPACDSPSGSLGFQGAK